MDINSLLSPQNIAEDTHTSTSRGLGDTLREKEPSSLTSRLAFCSNSQAPLLPPVVPKDALVQVQQTAASPPILGLSSGRVSATLTTPPSDDRARQPSTPGMDALAELASMQHDQHKARVNAGGTRNKDILEARQLSAVQGHADLQDRRRSETSPRPAGDLATQENSIPKTSRRTYATEALSGPELETLASLTVDLSENPYSYQSRIQLIGLLRQGLIAHNLSTFEQSSARDPHSYELLSDLRQARESMEVRFPLGEQLWDDWIADEMNLARTIEDRISVIELCQRATAEELGSVRLWELYGNWVTRLFNASHPGALGDLAAKHGLDDDSVWSDEDKAVGSEVFGWDMMLDVWRQGVNATERRINDSHLIWDRYAELVLEDLTNRPNQAKVTSLKDLFMERLRTPHANWDRTFQSFSTLITNYENSSYEDTMTVTTRRSAEAKSQYALREPYEQRLQEAIDSKEDQREWGVWMEYLEWEMALTKKKKTNYRLCSGLFERAVLRFASVASLWEDFVFFVVDQRNSNSAVPSPLPTLQRATRHCPWSGTLWAQYLLSCESEDQPFHKVEEVKHKATSMGLMDIGGMEEVLKAYDAWCCYLNRRAFHDRATDEEADVAEVGIRSAIETAKELGEKKHGKDYAGDPNYRLQRIYVEYLSRSGLWERARTEVWKALATSRGNSYEFWLRWYQWEMMYWFTMRNRASDKLAATPSSATAVLKQALSRQSLDWPEKVLEVYMEHVYGWESLKNLQAAVIFSRRVSRSITGRRLLESEQALVAQQQQQNWTTEVPTEKDLAANGKRKRDPSHISEDRAPKKSRQVPGRQEAKQEELQKPATTSALKRDREHTTVIVRNLPVGVTEIRIRQFFRDVRLSHIITIRVGG